ncbi:unnamed protein product [Dovyalis caffra]|uniref:Protein kinase domain-containing protein n=1 Tax=Dovyalis caffra TaxID=77055 RepID=A0AAV1S1Z1_9ROSI|nr:unnamed protein product [Dovyalis caffra]
MLGQGERMLGQRGTGCVHEGFLKNPNAKVVVKRIYRGYKHAKEVFTTELSIMSQLEHRNIMPLISWSNDGGEFLLVYGYMSNGSLDNHLLGNGMQLPRKARFNIALDLSSALHYLHQESEKCVLHRDIKSANVMLDSKINVKLGVFGAPMFLDHPDLALQTRKMVGTLDFVAPEYYYQGREACGIRKHKDEESQLGLVDWVRELYGAWNVLQAADERLNVDFNKHEMACLLVAVLWCAHPIAKQRPKISQAIENQGFPPSLLSLEIGSQLSTILCHWRAQAQWTDISVSSWPSTAHMPAKPTST